MRPEDDLLSSILSAYALRAGVYGHPSFCGRWQHSTAGMHRAAFHLIGTGGCWLHTRLAAPRQLAPGDLVVLPHDAWHMLGSSPQLVGDLPFVADDSQPEAQTTMVCGYFEFEMGNSNPVLDALPELIVIDAEQGRRPLRALAEMMLAEREVDSVGTRTVLDKLADTLFVMVVRHHLAALDNLRGVLAGLADERLRRALTAIHRQPGEPWTLEKLAETAHMSRSTFASHFNALVGVAPFDYLTRWRMTQAELALRNPRHSVAMIAEQMGYESEAAFRKAFKRVHGVGPGMIRRWMRDRLGKG